LLTFGAAVAVLILLELRSRWRRRQPDWEIMDRFVGLDGKEWYYLRKWSVGSAGDGGAGVGCHGGEGNSGGH
jgi:hypothetical protein